MCIGILAVDVHNHKNYLSAPYNVKCDYFYLTIGTLSRNPVHVKQSESNQGVLQMSHHNIPYRNVPLLSRSYMNINATLNKWTLNMKDMLLQK